MCVAASAEILELLGDGWARVSAGGNVFNINVKLVDCKPGDRVLVHAGCAIGFVNEREAAEINALLAELEEIYNE